MQHEITASHPLLDDSGNLLEAGWCRAPLLSYNREKICHPPEEIREWDYYFAGNSRYGLGFSTASVGNLHRLSVNFMDFQKNIQANDTAFCKPEDSTLHSPRTSDSSLHFSWQGAESQYIRAGRETRLKAAFPKLLDGEDLSADLCLEMPAGDTTVIVIPFDDAPGMFYYNHKINCIQVSGGFTIGKHRYDFTGQDAYAVMDWGRGVWPHQNQWYWGSASGKTGGKLFGLNIGYGFGNTRAATENMVVYGGVMHKLETVSFLIPDGETAFMKPWKFTSSDGRFEMDFSPVMDRHSNPPAGASYQSNQHQVFGYYSGTVVLDDGTPLKIDRLFGFAEKVVNDWPFSSTPAMHGVE